MIPITKEMQFLDFESFSDAINTISTGFAEEILGPFSCLSINPTVPGGLGTDECTEND